MEQDIWSMKDKYSRMFQKKDIFGRTRNVSGKSSCLPKQSESRNESQETFMYYDYLNQNLCFTVLELVYLGFSLFHAI